MKYIDFFAINPEYFPQVNEKLMRERGSLKEPSKFTQWLSDSYRKLGENLGLLKKQHKIFTHDKIIYI